MKEDPHSDSELKKIFQLKNIAVVGMSKNEEKAGHFVPRYLIENGYNVMLLLNLSSTQYIDR
jgi:uncharacterized protein